MKKRPRKQSSLALLVLVLFGDCALAGGWSSKHTIKSLTTYGESDLILIELTDGFEYTSGCEPNAWIMDADNEARRNRAYSTLTTAMASGKKVRFWYKDMCGTWNYHRANVVKITD